MPKGLTPSENFWAKVKLGADCECWEWSAYKNKLGYGQFGFRGNMKLAHRVAWILTQGEIPPGLLVCHTCDNPACCNPGHLWLGTNAENMSDMKGKGRGRSVQGAANFNAKLDEAAVREIRASYVPRKFSQQRLANKFGVSQVLVGKVIRREIWNQVK